MKKDMVIPIFIPWQGCISRCIYCNEKVTTGLEKAFNPGKCDEIINDYLKGSANYRRIQLGFYGGTFSNVESGLQLEFLEWGAKWIETGKVDSIRISTRPDFISENLLKKYKKYGVKTIEIGVQSFYDDVLDKINRRHSSTQSIEAILMLKNNGFEVGAHMMTGLPGSNYEKDRNSMKKLIELQPDTARIHPTIVLRNTRLEESYNCGKYIPETLEAAVKNCAEYRIMLEKENILVNRVGLFVPSENINDVVAGPFHPAFGDLVQIMSKINEILPYLERGYGICLSKKEFDSFFSHKGFFLPIIGKYYEKGLIKKY